jgi:hypothetical protein
VSEFAEVVRLRVPRALEAIRSGRPGAPQHESVAELMGGAHEVLTQIMSEADYAQDQRLVGVYTVLDTVANQGGSEADGRLALTNLQGLLKTLTANDSEIAGSQLVQDYRCRLHLGLDH